jgi:hypothetical protein
VKVRGDVDPVAAQHTGPAVEHGVPNQACRSFLDLGWQAWVRQTAGHLGADRNDLAPGCQVVEFWRRAALSVETTGNAKQTGAH